MPFPFEKNQHLPRNSECMKKYSKQNSFFTYRYITLQINADRNTTSYPYLYSVLDFRITYAQFFHYHNRSKILNWIGEGERDLTMLLSSMQFLVRKKMVLYSQRCLISNCIASLNSLKVMVGIMDFGRPYVPQNRYIGIS